MLSAGIAEQVQEPQLQVLIDAAKHRLTATVSYEKAVLGSDISFVIVPTPSDDTGAFCDENVLTAVREIGRSLCKKTDYHVVNIVATVMPGSTGGGIRDALEQSSGRRVGEAMGLCYNPEFIALGNVVRDLLNPDFILVGESDSTAGDTLESLYRSTCDNHPPIRRMDLMNAEIAKLALNTYVTTRITYANMLAEICERLPGADVDVVTSAIGLDSRVGTRSLKGATAYGGPCFPRDNRAFAKLARMIGARADILEATDRLNRYQVDRLVNRVRSLAAPGSTIGVLGLAYKPETPILEESPGLALAVRLQDMGYTVKVFDPMGLDAASAVLGADTATKSMEACAHEADVLVITTPWPMFSSLDPASVQRCSKQSVIIDCWRVLPKERFQNAAKIIYLGRGDDWLTANGIHDPGH